MNKSKKFSPEVKECAVRMVQEHRGDYQMRYSILRDPFQGTIFGAHQFTQES